jgi:Pyruvate/2-oxoacid:ferredoxin oxidoreductase delta subunit
LLQAFGVQERIFIGPQVRDGLRSAARSPGAGETLSRRAFFSLLARRTTGAAATTAAVAVDSILGSQGAQSEEDHRPKKGQLPVHLSAKRRLLLAALRRIGKAVDVDLEVDGRLWAQFDIEESCTGCQMCAFFCPTGALSKIEKDGRASVAFRISFCTNCRLCQDICYKAAVDLSSAVALSKVLEDAVDTFLMRDVNAAPWTGNR